MLCSRATAPRPTCGAVGRVRRSSVRSRAPRPRVREPASDGLGLVVSTSPLTPPVQRHWNHSDLGRAMTPLLESFPAGTESSSDGNIPVELQGPNERPARPCVHQQPAGRMSPAQIEMLMTATQSRCATRAQKRRPRVPRGRRVAMVATRRQKAVDKRSEHPAQHSWVRWSPG